MYWLMGLETGATRTKRGVQKHDKRNSAHQKGSLDSFITQF